MDDITFSKIVKWVCMILGGLLILSVGLVLLRAVISVIGWLSGSILGCIILAFITYKLVKKYYLDR